MIVFSGAVSDEIQAKTMNRRNRSAFKICAVGMGSVIIVGGVAYFLLDGDMKEWLILSGLAIIVILLQLWNPRKKLPFRWIYDITIDTEKIIVECPIWPKPLQKPIKKIKKVLDVGDCYYIIYADINNSIICQKDLLKEGTIQEFEELFSGKIVKEQTKK